MKRGLLAGILLAGVLGAQSFDVASVRKNTSYLPSPPGGPEAPPPPPPPPVLRPTPTGITIENATLKYCLQWAYDVRPSQVSGPGWLSQNRYDIYAKTGEPVPPEKLKLMLQALLTERFKLVLHRDTKQAPVLALVAMPGGSKLEPSKPGTASSRKIGSLPGGATRVVAENTGVDFLEQFLGLPIWDPVVNQTGLTGGFDFTFERPPMRAPDVDTMLANLVEAMKRQLGLKLEPRKAPMETIAIERGEQNPVEN